MCLSMGLLSKKSMGALAHTFAFHFSKKFNVVLKFSKITKNLIFSLKTMFHPCSTVAKTLKSVGKTVYNIAPKRKQAACRDVKVIESIGRVGYQQFIS